MAGLAGVGKSTLTGHVGATLRRHHVPVDTFGEEELFTRPQFTRVADGFRTKHYALPEDFEGAYEAWLSTLPAETVAIRGIVKTCGSACFMPLVDHLLVDLGLRAVRRACR